MATVFVAHRVQDRAEASRLSRELVSAGHSVWLDEWEIGVGDSIVGKMNDGLTGAAYVILCYSGAGVMSDWIGREWLSSLARQLNGHNVKILPARLTGGDPPAILADIRYADLVADWDQGVGELKASIK